MQALKTRDRCKCIAIHVVVERALLMLHRLDEVPPVDSMLSRNGRFTLAQQHPVMVQGYTGVGDSTLKPFPNIAVRH